MYVRNPNTPRDFTFAHEPVRFTAWWVGIVVLALQSAVLWGEGVGTRTIVIVIASQAITAISTGEIARRYVTPTAHSNLPLSRPTELDGLEARED